MLAAFGTHIGAEAADADFLYGKSSTPSGSSIVRLGHAGGEAEVIVPGVGRQLGKLLVDDTSVYWLSDDPAGQFPDGAIWRAPKTGGAATVVAHPIKRSSGMVADAERLYASSDARSTIVAVPKTGGAAVTVAMTSTVLQRIAAVDGTFVYWITLEDVGSGPVERLMRAPKTGGGEGELGQWVSNGEGVINGVIDDDAFVFAFDFGSVRRIAKSDGANAPLPSAGAGGNRGLGLSQDETWIYSASQNDDLPSTSFLVALHKDSSGGQVLYNSDQASISFVPSSVVAWGDSVYFGDGLTLYRLCKP